MLSNHFIFCRPLLLPSVLPSIRVFSDELALHIRWTKYWSFTFSISASNEYSGLISLRIDWFDFLVFLRDSQESSPAPQFESISSMVLFMVQLSTSVASSQVAQWWQICLPSQEVQRDTGSVPGSGRCFGVGNGKPLQYSYLENPMDRGAWWAIVYEVTKTHLNDWAHTHTHTCTH